MRDSRGWYSTGPTELWADDQGRLVQARNSTHLDVPAGTIGPGIPAERFAGRSTVVSPIRLSDCGTPATITAPPVTPTRGTGGGFAVLSAGTGCPA